MVARVRRYANNLLVYVLLTGASFGQQLARDFFDNTVVHDIHIDLDPNDWATLKQNYGADTYYSANVSSGSLAASQVAIRSRGRGSRSGEKPNLDVNIDKYIKKQTFAGLAFFILKAQNQDPSTFHEPIAFELFRKMGLPAPREAPARLYINGEYYGYYALIEHEDEDFLTRNLGEDGGDLFEWKPNASYNFEDLGDDPAPYANLLDPKTNTDNPDYQKFIALIKAINYSADADFVGAVSPYLDLRLYLTYVATENVLCEIDGIWDGVYGTNNIYLYRFQGQSLFQIIAWDKDLTFSSPVRPLPFPTDNVLARRLLAIPDYRNFYLSQVAKAADLFGGPGGWADGELSRMYALIHDTAVNDPHKQCPGNGGALGPCGAQEFEQSVQDARAFIAGRVDFVRTALAQLNYMPTVGGPVIDAVTLGAENGPSNLAPGSIVVVRGADFGSDTPTSSSPLPQSAGRSFVAVEGVRAPIISFSGSEALVQIPWDIPVGTTAAVAVAAGGALSNSVNSSVVSASPFILAVVHADGSLVTADQPAAAGETVVVYASGLGAVDTAIATGASAPPRKLVHTLQTPAVTVGAQQGNVVFSGLSPGTVGLYQINVVMPDNISSGAPVTLSISVDQKSTETSISVR
jgi:uncharacterized protein (TIGR03437 family)